ncbi:LysM peptidoglycan-binding domain-containing protein [Enterococcus sp. BWR-S5]|uniref:LysM peptidoglycan-binding domain-containing protein n=1 Tax=Enterococcus sp. BWR-S5 TaxID=2787714 RepID=UPI001924F0E9|nr:LysM peptidoglycan-binding domain-containing protein [Enterococcus sp. BWR-S5]MBL1223514.1 LysM peptidoglycan-binding domain-containing protein [Enterococcus sp. BWR-S5]
MEKRSRKERRKAEQYQKASMHLKKGTTVFSSALAVSSIAGTTVLGPLLVEATEDGAVSAEITPSVGTYMEQQQDGTVNTQENYNENTTTTEESSQTEETTDSSETEWSTEESTQEDSGTISSEDVSEETETSDSSIVDEIVGIESFAASARSGVSTASFIASIAGQAQTVAAANDLYASVMIAQAILESGSGASTLSQAPNYNLFGIKGSYNGQSVYMNTWEVINGENVIVNAAFRKYPSYTESFYDNAYVLRNTSFQSGVYFYSGTWKSNTNSYTDATAWLTGRYATDPNYGTKLNSLIAANNLTQYDTPSSGGGTGGNTGGNEGGNTGGSTGSSTNDTIHTVASGDSLWALASRYGTTIANIKSWNNLSSDTIYIGQKLIVKKGSGSSGGNTGGNTGGSSSGGSSGGSTGTTDTYYTVKSGDSLWAISSANGVSIANLRSWNNISGDIIYPGQRLIVKKGSGSSGGSTGGSTGGSSSGGSSGGSTGTTDTYYTVKSGDSLWAISSANGVSIANLRSWNNISGDIIHPGQRLIVKKGSGSSGGSTGGSTGGSSSGGSSSGGSTSTTDSYYTVKSGDSLWAISSANGVSIANLRSWNNISGDIIHPGQRLIVKKGSGSSNSSGGSSSTGSSTSGKTHTVKSGDTLWGLAIQYSTSINQLKQLNNLSGDVIFIGQQLKVA